MSDNETPVTGNQDAQAQSTAAVQVKQEKQPREQPQKPRKQFHDDEWYDLGGGG